MEIPGISNDILDNDLEEKVIGIRKDSDIAITSSDINLVTICHWEEIIPVKNKRAIVKFVNRKLQNLFCV